MLLRILVTCPAPTSPQWVTSVAKQRISGSTASKSARGPPTMTLSVPSCAACRVRAIGASSQAAPFAASCPAKSRVWLTEEVPRSTTTWPLRTCFRIPSPSNTARTCFALGRQRNSRSLWQTTSATEPAMSAPSARSRCSGSAERSNANTRASLFFTRLRQIGSPMTPRPMKPMVLYAVIASQPLFDERPRRRLVQGPRIDLVAGARIDFGDNRIMPGDEAIRMAGETLDGLPSRHHVADVVDDRKRAPAVQIGVVMRGVGGEHHRAALGLDPHHLQAIGMATDPMHGNAGRDLALAGMERDSLAIDMAHHLRDMLDRERMTQQAVAHAAPGRIRHFPVLQMKSRIRETVEIACVVVMQMGDDDILDISSLDAKARERIDRIERQLAPADLRLIGVEAGIDQDVAAAAANQPDEVIEVLGAGLMRIR